MFLSVCCCLGRVSWLVEWFRDGRRRGRVSREQAHIQSAHPTSPKPLYYTYLLAPGKATVHLQHLLPLRQGVVGHHQGVRPGGHAAVQGRGAPKVYVKGVCVIHVLWWIGRAFRKTLAELYLSTHIHAERQ